MSMSAIVYNELPAFSRKFSALLESGMPVMSVLNSLYKQTSNIKFKAIIKSLVAEVEMGIPLSDAMSNHSDVFDNLYVNLVKAGESSGRLPETMSRLATFLEASAKLRRKIKSAMIYPSFVVVIATVICTGMVTFIVPVFASLFEGTEQKLPGLTQMLMDLSDGLRSNGLEVMIGITIVVLLVRYYKATAAGSFFFDKMALRLPLFGDINRKVAATRFARTFGELTKSGIPILTALEISSGATGNDVTALILVNAKSVVENGAPLSSALIDESAFPNELTEMLQAGEKSGKVDEMMCNIANYLDDEIDATVSGLTSLLSPLIIVVLGVIIGTIIIAMFLPVIKLPGIL